MPLLESPSSSAKPKPRRKNRLRRAFQRLGAGPGRVRLLRVFGHSMSPVLNAGDLVVVNEDASGDWTPRKGQIVAARPSSLGGQAFVKRVAGLPSERVEMDGKVWLLADDEFFLIGDHTEHSLDSRAFGPVTREELVGPVHARVWPWTVFDDGG